MGAVFSVKERDHGHGFPWILNWIGIVGENTMGPTTSGHVDSQLLTRQSHLPRRMGSPRSCMDLGSHQVTIIHFYHPLDETLAWLLVSYLLFLSGRLTFSDPRDFVAILIFSVFIVVCLLFRSRGPSRGPSRFAYSIWNFSGVFCEDFRYFSAVRWPPEPDECDNFCSLRF